MRGLIVPEKTEDFTADPVELFFDLAFVFAFSQLVSHLVHHPTWTGFGEASLIFVLLWLGWSQYTWSANAVSGNSRVVRLIFLIGTVISVPMAASVGAAFGDGGPIFAVCLGSMFVLALWMVTSAHEPGSPEWISTVRYGAPNLLVAVLMIAGSFFERTPRIWIWLAALALFVYSTIEAGEGDWIVRAGHMAERHGLITIIALGEVIVAIGIGVVAALKHGEVLPLTSAISLTAAGVLAAGLWWSYFDSASPAFEHKAAELEGRALGRYVRDVYTYSHIPVVGGVIVSAAALEEITIHPDAVLHGEFRLMLFAGLLMFLGGVGLAALRAFRAFAYERVIAIAGLGAVLALGADLDGWLLLVLVDVVLLSMLAFEHMRFGTSK